MDKESWYTELYKIFKAHKSEWYFVEAGDDVFDNYFDDGDSPQDAFDNEMSAAR